METEMGYRGSKSKSYVHVEIDFVKEQRVDGSWFRTPKVFLVHNLVQIHGCSGLKVYSNGFRKILSS